MIDKIIADFINDNIDVEEKIKNDFYMILNSKRTIKDKDFFLVCLKKWNSASPKYPLNRSPDYVNYFKYDYTCGGGYFLVLGGYGLVIDPGYKFLETFYESGFVPLDIDGVFISHAHDDHCIDLEAIFSVIFKSNEDKEDSDKKKIDLFVNSTTKEKFSKMFKNDEDMINKIKILDEEIEIIFGRKDDVILKPLNTCHKEMPWQKNKEKGRGFNIDFRKKIILYSSDTEYMENLDIINQPPYDILILNIGKLGKNSPGKTKAHLGLEGVKKILTKYFELPNFKNSVLIISELGFELKNLRFQIITTLRNYINRYYEAVTNIDNYSIPLKIIYAEPGTIIDFEDNILITRLEIKLRDVEEFSNIIKEIDTNIHPLIYCIPIQYEDFTLEDGNQLDIAYQHISIEKNQVFIPINQTLFDTNSVKKIEKLIFTRIDRINKIDAIKFGSLDRQSFIDFLENKYIFTDDVYLTLFEFVNIKN